MDYNSVRNSKFLPSLCALLLGASMSLSQAPWNWWWAGIVSASGLLLLLKNISSPHHYRKGFWLSFWYGMGLFGAGASWVFISIHEHGNASIPLAATLTLLFVSLPALSFALPMSLFRLFSISGIAALLVFPSLWVAAEWFRSWLFTGFPWLYFGYGFIDSYLSGWAPVGGVLIISWIGAFCSSMLVFIPEARKHPQILLGCLVLTAGFWLSGWYLYSINWTKNFTPDISVGVIQPSLPLSMKWDQRRLEEILDLYRRQTDELLDQDIIVWPESAIPQLQHRVSGFLSSIDATGRLNGAAIITGIPTQHADGRYYNSVIALGDAQGAYHKQHLVPFGEYVPLEQWLRGAIDFFDLPMSQFSPGPENQPLIEAKGLKISSAICYEIVFPDLVASSAANAEILLTLSNDSWFGDSLGPKQHLQMARMRALENGKPLIRATNDGLTALIDKRGTIVAAVPPFQQTVLKGRISPQRGQTPFNQWRSFPIVLLSIAILLVAALKSRKSKPH